MFNFRIDRKSVGKHTIVEEKEFAKKFEKELWQGYQITKNIAVRRIRPAELACYVNSNLYRMEGQISSQISEKSFVLEISSQEWKDANKLVNNVLLALRLLKEEEVFCKVIWMSENSQICNLTVTHNPVPWSSQNYILMTDEIDSVKDLLNRLSEVDLDNNKTFRIACERFNRAYEERRDDDTIIDFTIAFESLFFEGSKAPSSSTGQFVGLGCSMLLGKDKQERKEITQFFTQAYEIRNKIVHGSEIPNPIKIGGKNYTLEDLAKKLQDYLRSSILKLMV